MSSPRIALFADTHDRLDHMAAALDDAKQHHATHLLHAGDLCSPFVIGELAKQFAGPIHIVFGNNDGDGRLCSEVAARYPHVHLHGPYVELEIDDLLCAVIHYPEPALRIAQSGHLDLVLYGHDHKAHHSTEGRCHLVNPGELMGRLGTPSWGLFDCATRSYERILLKLDKE